MDQDFDFFRHRAIQEREAATKAAHPVARSAHLQMAERYDQLTDTGGGADAPPSARIPQLA